MPPVFHRNRTAITRAPRVMDAAVAPASPAPPQREANSRFRHQLHARMPPLTSRGTRVRSMV